MRKGGTQTFFPTWKCEHYPGARLLTLLQKERLGESSKGQPEQDV